MTNRHVLFQRDFGRYWVASLLATSGMWLWRITGPVMIYELTDSAVLLGVQSVASYGPILLLSPISGVLADRVPRRPLVAACHTFIGCLFVGLALLSAAGALSAGVIVAAGVLEGAVWSIAKPAVHALVSELVEPEDLTSAVAVNTSQFSIGQLIGPVVAAVMLDGGNHGVALVLAGLLYLPTAIVIPSLARHRVYRPARQTASGASMLRGGLGLVRDPLVLSALMSIALGSIALEGAVRAMAPKFASDALNRPESMAGLLIASQATASIGAVAVVTYAARKGRDFRYALLSYPVMAVAIVVYAQVGELAVAMVLAGIIGAGQTIAFSVATGQMQAATEPGMRGRVMALHAMALLGTRPLAGMVAGFVASTAGTRVACAGFAVAALGGIAVLRWQRRLLALGSSHARGSCVPLRGVRPSDGQSGVRPSGGRVHRGQIGDQSPSSTSSMSAG